jgi:hypothetical protein
MTVTVAKSPHCSHTIGLMVAQRNEDSQYPRQACRTSPDSHTIVLMVAQRNEDSQYLRQACRTSPDIHQRIG